MLHITVESSPPWQAIVHCASLCAAMPSLHGRHCGLQLMIAFISNFRFLTLNNSTLAFIPTCSQWSRGVTGSEYGHMWQTELILNIRDVTTPLCYRCSYIALFCCGYSISQWSFMEWANKVCTGLVRSAQQPDPKLKYDSLNGQNALSKNTE